MQEYIINSDKLGWVKVVVRKEEGKKVVNIFSEYFDIIAEELYLENAIEFVEGVIKTFSKVLNILIKVTNDE